MPNKRRRFTASQKATIVLEALKEEKSIAQIAAENGVQPNQIQHWKKQALENFNQLFEDERQGEKIQEAEHVKQLNNLYAEIGRLSAQLSWLKKSLACMSRAERLSMLEKDDPELSLKVQEELLAIKRRIDEIYTARPYYDSRRITQELRTEFGVARPTIQRYMGEMGNC